MENVKKPQQIRGKANLKWLRESHFHGLQLDHYSTYTKVAPTPLAFHCLCAFSMSQSNYGALLTAILHATCALSIRPVARISRGMFTQTKKAEKTKKW